MRIQNLKVENICGVESGEIAADGANVYILAQNGSGKTTYANAYSLCLTGKFFDGMTGEVNYQAADGSYIRDKRNHAVEVTFDNGTAYRREFVNQFDKAGNFKGVTQKFYVDGVPLKQKAYDAKVQEITQGAPINPFGFCTMKWQKRRNLLLSMIHFDETAILQEFSELKIGKLDAQSFIDFHKSEMKKKVTIAETIPARIDELQKNLVEGDLSAVQEQFSAKSAEVMRLQAGMKNPGQAIYLMSQCEMRIATKAAQIAQSEKNFEELSKKFAEVKKAKVGKCPHCDQPMPLEKFQQKQRAKLEKLKQQGWDAKAEIEYFKQSMRELKAEREKWQARLEENAKNQSDTAALEKAMRERDELQQQITRLQVSEQNRKRIEELKQREVALNAEIAENQKQINLAEKFQRRKIKAIEDEINAKFDIVKFKMFEVCINGTIKETCEPMINGVTFENLSKGEKLKAALDILKTMQKFYQVELPVWIDDAESYTSNSLVELPNQIFYLKAVEGQAEIKIEVEEKAVAA